MPIDLTPGGTIRRSALHERYGGRRQGGISPSKVSPNVFLITAPAKGDLYGDIYDGPRDDGYFHYTGEGQYGDQRIVQGNRAVRDHVTEGRELHVFEADDTELRYLGPFAYVDHYYADAPETNNGRVRSVVVFRLKQLDGIAPAPSTSPLDRLSKEPIEEIPVEQIATESTLVQTRREPYEAARREQRLVLEFLESLLRQGHDVCRLQFRPPGEPAALYCDLFDKTTNTLYEAKGSVARPAIRMAVGQLADYARLLRPPPRKALLVPQRPRPDLIDLLSEQSISVTWREGGAFVSQPT